VLIMCGVFSPHLASLLILLGINQAVMLVKDIYQGFMQRHDRMDLVAVSSVLQGVLSVGAAGGTAIVSHNLQLTVAAMLVARVFVFVAYDIPTSRALRSNGSNLVTRSELCKVWSESRCRSLVRKAVPLGVTTLLLSLYPNIPRYFIATYYGDAYVGYFAAIATLMSLQDLIVIPLSEAAIRRLSLFYATNKMAYVRLLVGLMGVGAIIGAVGVAAAWRFGHFLLPLLFRTEYGSFVEALVWLMAARLVLNIQCFMGYSITAAGKYSSQVWIWGLGVASLLVASWLLIPTRSALGAAWALCICACITTGASLVVIAGALRSSKSPQPHPAILQANV
jgi:O-antigen/teichoic acid export membrane protein